MLRAVRRYASEDARSDGQPAERGADALRHYALHAEAGRFDLVGHDADLRVGRDETIRPGGIPSAEAVGTPTIRTGALSGSAHGSSSVYGSLTDSSTATETSHTRPTLEGELLLAIEVLKLGRSVPDGAIVEAVTMPWGRLVAELEKDPDLLYRYDPRKMEELVAAAYDDAGEFDEVTLTSRSNDGGRDVIAVRRGQFSIRVLDQVKRYSAGRRVTADDVRAMYGVLNRDAAASKAYVTTTSEFAPGVAKEFESEIPTRLDLRDGAALIDWFKRLAKESC